MQVLVCVCACAFMGVRVRERERKKDEIVIAYECDESVKSWLKNYQRSFEAWNLQGLIFFTKIELSKLLMLVLKSTNTP